VILDFRFVISVGGGGPDGVHIAFRYLREPRKGCNLVAHGASRGRTKFGHKVSPRRRAPSCGPRRKPWENEIGTQSEPAAAGAILWPTAEAVGVKSRKEEQAPAGATSD
jgi:hypothetical protein